MDKKEKPRILIVDDERTNITVLNNILKSEYAVLAAIDGKRAIDIAIQNVPDLILLDIVMPGMTGFEVLTELKRNKITSNIPVIFITGLDSTEDEATGFFLGAVDYITKPFRNSIVMARVKTHVQLSKYIQEIEYFGLVDPLTGIPNRRSLDNRISIEWERSLREKEPFSILMLDIDRFKAYNDEYGHPQGDVLLQHFARILTKSINRKVDFVARMGGEEFIVLLPNNDLSGALVVAERIRTNVENTLVLCSDGTPTSITISIGVNTEIPTTDSILTDFIANTDKALYAAKNSGRNKVCSYEAANIVRTDSRLDKRICE